MAKATKGQGNISIPDEGNLPHSRYPRASQELRNRKHMLPSEVDQAGVNRPPLHDGDGPIPSQPGTMTD